MPKTKEQYADIIKKLISEHSGVDVSEIKDETVITTDLDLDSLDVVEIVMQVEDELDVEIADDDFTKYPTVKQLTDYIVNQLN